MKQQTETYEPFGKEWEAEMMKWTKADLILFLRRHLLTLERAKNVIGKYDPENGDPGDCIGRIENLLYNYSG